MFSCTKRKKVEDYYESMEKFSIHDDNLIALFVRHICLNSTK